MVSDSIKKASGESVVLIGIPFDENSSYIRGTAAASARIREALLGPIANVWSESGTSILRKGAFFDAGDLDFGSTDNPFKLIERTVYLALERGLKPICIGGDHSVTYPIINAFSRRFSRISLLQIDAHPDLYDEFDGNRFSHACPFARIMEEQLVDRLVQVGIRASTCHLREQAERFGVEVIEMNSLSEALILTFDSPVYISFDIDGLDPAFAPGVSHPEPGGLSTRQAIGIVQSLEGEIVGADIVELNPSRDINGLTALVAAKVVKEIIALCSPD